LCVHMTEPLSPTSDDGLRGASAVEPLHHEVILVPRRKVLNLAYDSVAQALVERAGLETKRVKESVVAVATERLRFGHFEQAASVPEVPVLLANPKYFNVTLRL
jgi:hypothetical protein